MPRQRHHWRYKTFVARPLTEQDKEGEGASRKHISFAVAKLENPIDTRQHDAPANSNAELGGNLRDAEQEGIRSDAPNGT